MPNGTDNTKHEDNPATLSKLPAVAIPDLGTIDNNCAKKKQAFQSTRQSHNNEKAICTQKGHMEAKELEERPYC